MTASGKTGTLPPAGGASRTRRAQVEIIGAGLPLTIWLNPSWAAVAAVPFVAFSNVFGSLAPWRLAAAIGLHLANAAIAAALHLRFRRNPSDTGRWLVRLTAFQGLIGTSWGLLVWLLWVPGNALNHVMVVVPIVAVLWTYAASRSTNFALYFAGVLPIFVLAMARFLMAPGEASAALAIIFPITFLYTMLIAAGGRKLTDAMLRARFANEDLANELRTARDEALRKRHEAEAANASKSKFLANMSHELRTPLNAILGFSDLIANEMFGPVGVERYRDYAHDIHASGAHLLTVINDILAIARIESGKMKIAPAALDPKAVIDKALRTVAPRAQEKHQTISVFVAPDAHEVWADERAFTQILVHLTTNAVKFTQDGGAIAIHGRHCSDGGFELTVEDNGPGIEASALDSAFQPFNQTDERYNRREGGTGLGLALVRGLAALHDGSVWIETEFGVGLKAHVYFPAGNSAAMRQPPAQLSA